MVKLYDDKKYRPSTREWSNITCSPLLQVSQVDNEFQGSTETVQDDTTNAVVKDDFNVQAIEGHSGSVMKALFLNDASSYLEICPPVKNDTKSVKAHQNSDVQSYSFLHNASGKCTNLSSIITMTIHLCIIWQFLVMSDGI